MFPLLMKPTGWIDFAFDTGLMVCLRDDKEDSELQISFERSLSLQLGVEGVQSLLFLAIQIQKEHSIEDLINFLIEFLIRVLLKPSFLKKHKTDLEQYPLAPTFTAQSSTHQLLDSMIVFKAKYLLILVLCQDSILSLQGHVSSMRITFLKLFEKIVTSGLSWVKTMWNGKQKLLLRSAKRTQFDAWCKMPTEGVLLCGNFAPFFTNFIDDLAEIDTASFIFEIKVLRTLITWCNTLSCLNAYLPWSSDTL